jgi:hypothetical protein
VKNLSFKMLDSNGRQPSSIRLMMIHSKNEGDRLDQAILTQAFSGELVPQDPTDEPADILLDPCGICEAARIRTEKQDPPKAKKVKSKHKPEGT